MNVRHSSETVEHYTPAYIVDAVRGALGGHIDLDPASCDSANETVKARSYFTKERDGLAKLWIGNVFLNPPGGRIGTLSSQKVFWQYLMQQYDHGHTTAAVFLSFSVELLQTSQVNTAYATPHDFHICFPSRRIAYTREDGTKGKSPPHSSMLVYIGNRVDLFKKSVAHLGKIMGPA